MIWDFGTIMVLLVAVTGGIWALDHLVLAPRRAARNGEAGELPILVDYAKSFFPVFLLVLLLRSFLVEPFRIPSGSMVPTLLVGDFILVNKFTYGIRLPAVNRKVIELGSPARGDVVVFRYPVDPSVPFIKRVIGIPGDRIVYRDHRLLLNGEAVPAEDLGSFIGTKSAAPQTGYQRLREQLPGHAHDVIINPQGGFECPREGLETTFNCEATVPPGHYFVMGDNRDNSRDSRFWGFVPDENLVGRAFFIWFNWDNGPALGRIGQTIK